MRTASALVDCFFGAVFGLSASSVTPGQALSNDARQAARSWGQSVLAFARPSLKTLGRPTCSMLRRRVTPPRPDDEDFRVHLRKAGTKTLVGGYGPFGEKQSTPLAVPGHDLRVGDEPPCRDCRVRPQPPGSPRHLLDLPERFQPVGLNPSSVAELRRVLRFSRYAEPIVLPDGIKLASPRESIAYLVKTIPAAERRMPVFLTV